MAIMNAYATTLKEDLVLGTKACSVLIPKGVEFVCFKEGNKVKFTSIKDKTEFVLTQAKAKQLFTKPVLLIK